MMRERDRWGSSFGSSLARCALGCAAGGVVLLGARMGAAQTWQGTRDVPSVTEIVAIDASGEPGWQYGAEDVAGDGLDNFSSAEERIDFRSAYATTDSTEFWFRLYAVSTGAASEEVTAFVFIDSDRNATTGGRAGPAFDQRLSADNSLGGYEYVIGVRGNGSLVGVWRWQAASGQFAALGAAELQRGRGVVGQADDPLRAGVRNHGYVEGVVDLSVVGLTQLCDANLYFRTVQDTVGLGPGDLDVGAAGPCRPVVTSASGVPDLVNPTTQNPDWRCQTDADCPAGGVCVNGVCLYPAPSVDAGQAAAGTSGPYLEPGELLQGGAWTCSLGQSRSRWSAGLMFAALMALGLRRRSRRAGQSPSFWG